jgi:dTMP kinase
MRGKLIVLDGTDGAGKGTQTELLVKRLNVNGFETEMFDFPQYGQKSAGLVEDYLNGKYGAADEVDPYVASTFYTCDRFEASPRIKNTLAKGINGISNRYTSSSMGHQTGKIKNLEERDKYLAWLADLEFNIFGIPRPDLTLLLYMPVEVGQQLVDAKGHRDYVKGIKRDIHESDLQHLRDAAEAYKYVAQKFNWPIINCAPDGTMNSLRSIEDINDEIYSHVSKFIG